MLDDGEIERRVRLIRPMERLNFALNHLAETSWEAVDEATFAATWQTELAQVDEFDAKRIAHRHRPAAADLETAS
jgi:hypothetical protein